MAIILKRYWFEFEYPRPRISHEAYIPACGCGVTALDFDDAMKIVHRFFLLDHEIPKFSRIVENIDVSTIEDKDVLSNLGVPVWRGVWYPAYNLWWGAYTDR